MIKNKQTFFLGIFIFLIPFLGFPSFWKTTFIILSALTLIWLSIKIDLPKRGSLKPVRRKGKATPVFSENSPMPKMDSVIAPQPTIETKEEI